MTAHSSACGGGSGYGAIAHRRASDNPASGHTQGAAADAGLASSRMRRGIVACLLATSVAIATLTLVSTPPSGDEADLAITNMILSAPVEPSVLLSASAPGALCLACFPRLFCNSVRARGSGAYVARWSLASDTFRVDCRLSRAPASDERGKFCAGSARRCVRSALTPAALPVCPCVTTRTFLNWLRCAPQRE
jgi:hypothetical protein